VAPLFAVDRGEANRSATPRNRAKTAFPPLFFILLLLDLLVPPRLSSSLLVPSTRATRSLLNVKRETSEGRRRSDFCQFSFFLTPRERYSRFAISQAESRIRREPNYIVRFIVHKKYARGFNYYRVLFDCEILRRSLALLIYTYASCASYGCKY
jgi:hypothetical protein